MMGAKLAAPDKLCVNFMGDAAFGMVGMEVETAAREGIGLLTVLINNQGMAGYAAWLSDGRPAVQLRAADRPVREDGRDAWRLRRARRACR